MSQRIKGTDKDQVQQPPSKYGVVVTCIVVLFVLVGFLLWTSIGRDAGAARFPIAWFIIICAVVGSVVNEPFRKKELHPHTYGWVAAYISWKASVAVVFAFVLYLMAIGGLVGGDMFPQFVFIPPNNVSSTDAASSANAAVGNMDVFVTAVKPASYKDVAKVLVWSFIAGYSERLVPNLVGQVIKGADAKKQGI